MSRCFPLPDISKDRYFTPPERRERALKGLLSGTPLRMYFRYALLVIWSGLKFVFGKDPQKMVTLQALRVMRIAERNGASFHIEGLDQYPASQGPYVFACNHMSSLEVNTLPGLVASRTPMTFVIKTNLLKVPFFGRVLRRLQAIAVERRHPGKDLITVLEEGTELLSSGTSIILFPQGTRNTSFQPSGFNTLAVKLAARAGVPVIPVALKTDFWGNGKIIKEFGPVQPDKKVFIEFGAPIFPSGRGREEHQKIIGFIMEKLQSWGVDIQNQPR